MNPTARIGSLKSNNQPYYAAIDHRFYSRGHDAA